MVCLAVLADAVLAAPPKLGATRLVCVDGPAGAGKSTLAAELARNLRARTSAPVPVVTMDDLYAGWEEPLDVAARRLERQVLGPLRRGEPGLYQRYDWHAGSFADWQDVPVGPVLIVEGVGAAPGQVAPQTSLLVWLDAPAAVRLRRGIERDGEQQRQQWLRWMAKEQRYLARQGTADRADIVVDGGAAASDGHVVVRRGWPLRLPG